MTTVPLQPQQADIVSFMRRFNFALMVNTQGELPLATHLPFVIKETEGQIRITSHFNRANPQAKCIASQESLIVFSEPHAYISPTHYDHQENVPTWNYVSVHAYGRARLIEKPDEVTAVLEEMIEFLEPSYKAQWNDISQEYKSKLARGITAFEFVVSRLDFKEKLSQNKTANERQNIINALAKSDRDHDQLTSEYMARKS